MVHGLQIFIGPLLLGVVGVVWELIRYPVMLESEYLCCGKVLQEQKHTRGGL